MAEPKAFLLFLSHWEQLEELTVEEFHNVLQAIFAFAGADCAMPENMSRIERIVFRAIRGDVGRSLDNYNDRCKIFSEAGRKGGLKRAENARRKRELTEAEATQTNASPLEPPSAPLEAFQANQAKDNDKANDNAKAKDNESVRDKVTAAPCAARESAAPAAADAATHAPFSSLSSQANPSQNAAEAHFEALWALWPNKRDKNKVSSESKQTLLAVSEEDMQQAIDRYVAEVKASPADRQWLNGSTWFNGRYRDYIGDDYCPSPALAGTAQPSQRSRQAAFRAPNERCDWSDLEE